MTDREYRAILIRALAHERAGRWSEASDAWRAAAKLLEGKDTLQSGAILEHRKRGVVRATCVWLSDSEVIYEGQSYGSLLAAANAAARVLGLRVRDGQLFWGVRKYASPTFAVTAKDDVEESEAA